MKHRDTSVRHKTGARFVGHMFYSNWTFPVAVVLGSLAIGILGYHFAVGLSWIDAVLNASMILTGMGQVNPIETAGGKIFASFYALYSGVVFLAVWTSFLPGSLHHVMQHFQPDARSTK